MEQHYQTYRRHGPPSSCADLGCFNTALEAIGGVHAGGHFTIGGIALNAFASASDPAFYLHYAQVDRVWALWQNLNSRDRTNQVYVTSTAFNGDFPFHYVPSSKFIFGAHGLHALTTSSTKPERDIEHRD